MKNLLPETVMKNILLYTAAAAMLAACGAATPSNDLDHKRAERDSLKAVYAELGVKIKEVETWLAENDSTVRRNLATVTAAPLVAGPFATVNP